MSRATMSRDGNYRLTIRTEVRLGADDLAACLAYAVVRDLAGFDSDEWTPEDRAPGRERILTAARQIMRDYGTESYAYWGDDTDGLPFDADDLRDWTAAAVARRFPELGGRRG